MDYYDVLFASKLSGGGGGGDSSYQLCEYIQNTGNSFIDTQISANAYDTLICNIEFDSVVAWEAIFGSQDNATNLVNAKRFGIGSGTWQVAIICGSNDIRKTYSFSANTKYKLEYQCSDSNRYMYINNTAVQSPTEASYAFTSGYPAYIFCCNYAGTTKQAEYFLGKVYDFTFYKNGQIVAEFLPAYDKTTLEVGLLETISGSFYTNKGTGSFVKGGDVNQQELLGILLGQ